MTQPGSKRVMLVEDDDRLAFNLRLLLETEGYEVERLVNGLGLLDELERIRPDVILLDVMLSWVNGLDLCKAVKEADGFSHTPVIIISGRVSDDDVARGREVGCDDYFTKPLDLDRLFARMDEVIARA